MGRDWIGTNLEQFLGHIPNWSKEKREKKEAYSFIQKGFTNPKKSQKNFNFNKKQLDF